MEHLIDYLSMVDWFILFIVFALIVVDIISGLIKGVVNKSMQSGVMWTGLLKKTAYFIIIILALLLDAATARLELPIPVDLFAAVCVFIILIEACSILENIVAIDPNLKLKGIFSIFGMKEKEEENAERD